MTSILLLANDDRGFASRLGAALDLARACNGHLTCLQARPFNSFVVADPFGGVYAPTTLLARLEEVDLAHQQRIEARLRGQDVPWDWVRQDGETGHAIVARASLADVIVLTLPGDDDAALAVAGEVALHARSAILAVPTNGSAFDPGGRVMVAWNGSPEAAHALRLALPLLARASGVVVVTVAEERGRYAPLEASHYLSRHGISSELVERGGGGRRAADALVEAATAVGAGAIVMGAYGHTRLREAVLGGVTRDMLRHCPLPLVLAH